MLKNKSAIILHSENLYCIYMNTHYITNMNACWLCNYSLCSTSNNFPSHITIMKRTLALILYIASTSSYTYAQKPLIDKIACDGWPTLQEINGKSCILSGNGKYVVYQLSSPSEGNTTFIKEINGPTLKKFHNASKPIITPDNKYYISLLPGDSLVIQSLETSSTHYITTVTSFAIPTNGTGEWLVYKTKGPVSKTILKSLFTEKEFSFENVEEVLFNKQGHGIVIRKNGGLIWLNLKDGKEEMLPQSSNVTDMAFDNLGKQLAFITNVNDKYQLKYFKLGNDKTRILIDSNSSDININYELTRSSLEFSKDGAKIFFKIKHKNTFQYVNKKEPITKSVNIWSYKDIILQPKQINDLKELGNKSYIAVITINSGKAFQVETDTLQLSFGSVGNKFAILSTRVSEDEYYWNGQKKGLFLISLEDGSLKKIYESIHPYFNSENLSPKENYIVWFNGNDKNFYSYEITTGIQRNISSSIKEALNISYRGEADKIAGRTYAYAPPIWLPNDQSLLIYDHSDIWEIDPLGLKAPANITNGYGKKNNISFRLLEERDSPFYLSQNEILLWAFNNANKENGFWKLELHKEKYPTMLSMDNHAYFFIPTSKGTTSVWGYDSNPANFKPLKAPNKKLYVVRRMGTTEAPNLFCTKDFKSFTPITNSIPHKQYNWMTSELVTWTLPNGLNCDGILFKPENFDSTKQYPVIFNYYERRSEGLNVYRTPGLSGHNINIPWFVSRGYLVFEPDIYYHTGKVAQNIIEIVESAVKYLSTRPYIDISRIGLQGQSFGGYETNVIVTGSNLFAAACEMAGPTNIISEYGSITQRGKTNQTSADMGQRNIAAFPWENPELFIENSPVFNIKKMNTPLLMIHNRRDGAILFSQAVELYLALRRANKRVWMLEYDEEDHEINEENNKLDFTIRMQQFFDHYLNNKPAPKWMTRGISAKEKGITSGLELDTESIVP